MNLAPAPPSTLLRDALADGQDAVARAGAAAWEGLVRASLRWLEMAAGRIRDRTHTPDHQAAPEWLGTGRHRVRGKEIRLPEEDTVTDALVRTAMDLYDDLEPDDPIRVLRLYMVDQRPRVRDRLGARSRPTDIQVASREHGVLDLRIEAKRLIGGAHLTSYLGADGLRRFSDDLPYTVGPVGMMLGYTFRYDEAHWWRELERRCIADALDWREVVDHYGRRLRSTTLPRRALTPVLVVHAMLPFEGVPSARDVDQEHERTRTGSATKDAASGC